MCFDILCNLLEILLINYGKPSSSGSIDRGAGPPGVHQIGGPNFGQVCTAQLGRVWGNWDPGLDAKMRELAVLFARMSQLCQRLGLSILAHLHRPPFFKH